MKNFLYVATKWDFVALKEQQAQLQKVTSME